MDRTNASPVYLLIFISATYCLNRPCVYCSLLLAILVLSLFDFKANWFSQPEARNDLAETQDSTAFTEPTSLDMASVSLAALNESTCALINETAEAVRHGVKMQNTWSSSYVAWAKKIFMKEGWHLQNMDINFRL